MGTAVSSCLIDRRGHTYAMRYFVTLVRFDGGHKTYPVNGVGYSDGDQVCVRMDWGHRLEFTTATVVGEYPSFSGKPCRHSIACHVDRLDTFGDGPDAIRTEAGLVRFATEHRRWHSLAVTFREGWETQPWHTGYVPITFKQDDDRPIFVIGTGAVGVSYASHRHGMTIKDGTLVFTQPRAITPMSGEGEEIYRKAAAVVFGDWSEPDLSSIKREYIPFTFNGD